MSKGQVRSIVLDTLHLMRNSGLSWRMVADEVSTEQITVSSALVRKVAIEKCNSPKIEMALGLREVEVTVPLSQVRKRPRGQTPRQARCRLGLDVTEELRAEFHRRRGEMTGGEYLAALMEDEYVGLD